MYGGEKFPLIQLPRKSEVLFFLSCASTAFAVSINSTSEEVRRTFFTQRAAFARVSINSTSEEVRSFMQEWRWVCSKRFPLIQLPRKSEAKAFSEEIVNYILVSINSTSEEVRSRGSVNAWWGVYQFPLIQLPRKSEVDFGESSLEIIQVSINSTSEEVRSTAHR